MKTWVRKSLSVGVLAAGAVLFSGGAAMADAAPTTSDNFGIGSGAQALIPIQVPVNLCGNSVSGIAAASFAECTGGAVAGGESAPDMVTSGNYGVLSGVQAYAPITAPLDLCGNSVALVGGASFAGCEGGTGTGTGNNNGGGYGEEAAKVNPSARGAGHAAAQGMMTSGNVGILNGVQVNAPIQVPINACGLSIAGIAAGSLASCEGGAVAESARTEGAAMYTTGNYGALNGLQLFVPVQLPIDISGNAISGVAGSAFANSTGGAAAMGSGESRSAKAKRHSGEALPVVGSLPINDLLGGLGGAQHAARSLHDTEGDGGSALMTSDNYGVLSGAQVFAPIKIAADITGNAISGIGGAAFASSTGGASTR